MPYRLLWVASSAITALLPYPGGATPLPDPWYLGAKAGWVKSTATCNASACADPVSSGLFGGYLLGDGLALEAGYDRIEGLGAPEHQAGGHAATDESTLEGLSLVAKPYWPLDAHWSLFGKVGAMLWHRELDGQVPPGLVGHGASPWLGAGLEYRFNRNWHTTLEYQWLGWVSGDESLAIQGLSLGMIYRPSSASVPEPVLAPEVPPAKAGG